MSRTDRRHRWDDEPDLDESLLVALGVPTVPTAMWCRSCGSVRDPHELLRLTDVRSGTSFVVCRPSTDIRCFASLARPASEQRIEQVAPDPGAPP